MNVSDIASIACLQRKWPQCESVKVTAAIHCHADLIATFSARVCYRRTWSVGCLFALCDQRR